MKKKTSCIRVKVKQRSTKTSVENRTQQRATTTSKEDNVLCEPDVFLIRGSHDLSETPSPTPKGGASVSTSVEQLQRIMSNKLLDKGYEKKINSFNRETQTPLPTFRGGIKDGVWSVHLVIQLVRAWITTQWTFICTKHAYKRMHRKADRFTSVLCPNGTQGRL